MIFLLSFLSLFVVADEMDLGKELFFDRRLSLHNNFSCASCHDINTSGENNLAFAILPNGKHSRHSVPTILNVDLMSSFFWDGSAKTLEEQAEGPLAEMNFGNLNGMLERLNTISGYRRQFNSVFKNSDIIQLKEVTSALAVFEKTLVNRDSPYDLNQMGPSAKSGYNLFKSIGCANCHGSIQFAGASSLQKFPVFFVKELEQKYHFSEDLGRYYVTQNSMDKNLWRVPNLRNIELTAPYFHNGSVSSLDEAVQIMARTQLGLTLTSKETNELCDFLKSLTGKALHIPMPEFSK